MATDIGFQIARVLGFLHARTFDLANLRRANERREYFACPKGGVGCQHFSPRQPGRMILEGETSALATLSPQARNQFTLTPGFSLRLHYIAARQAGLKRWMN